MCVCVHECVHACACMHVRVFLGHILDLLVTQLDHLSRPALTSQAYSPATCRPVSCGLCLGSTWPTEQANGYN